jgi:hypothetical protein
MTMAQMRMFLAGAVDLEKERRKALIGAINLGAWGDADDIKAATR